MYTLQRVINLLSEIKPEIKNYVLNLLLSRGLKNCTAMSLSTGLSRDSMYKFLSNSKQNIKEMETKLLSLAQSTRKTGIIRTLVIDPTSIIKNYAKKIEKLCKDRSGCTNRVESCFVPVYAMLIDKNITIPITFDFWVQKKIIGMSKYKSKVRIVKELIIYLKKLGLSYDYCSLDGAFSSSEMLNFFKENSEYFIMRIAKNRLIKAKSGISSQLKNHPELRLNRNERSKTITAQINGVFYFFTSQKRKTVNGDWEVVFLISNMNLSAKEQIKAYDLRWLGEETIRTTKQKLGAGQCQMIKATKQKAHILAGFLAYTVVSLAKNDKLEKNVDEVINNIRKLYFNDLINIPKASRNLEYIINVDPVAKTFQNSSQKIFENNY